jgi:hypothetical protein
MFLLEISGKKKIDPSFKQNSRSFNGAAKPPQASSMQEKLFTAFQGKVRECSFGVIN